MLKDLGGGSEPGFIGLALVDSLFDLLISKGLISNGEARAVCLAAAKRLGESGKLVQQGAAKVITDGMPS